MTWSYQYPKSIPQVLAQVSSCNSCIVQRRGLVGFGRISLRRILLSLDHHPAVVSNVLENLHDGIQVQLTFWVAWHGENPALDRLIEAGFVLRSVSPHVSADILQVDVSYASSIFLC